MKARRLCLIRSNRSKTGGAEVYLSRLSTELTLRGIAHEVIYSPFPRWLPSWIRAILFNLYVGYSKKNKFYFSLDRISCPDIYRAGDGVHKVYMRIERKSLINPLHAVYLYLEKKCFNRAKKIIANSEMIKDQIIETYQIDPRKIEVIYNGIASVDYSVEVALEKLSREFNIQEGEKIILYVGSGFKRKGVKAFLEILSRVQYKNFKAFIVGKEKKIVDYKKMAHSLNLSDKVIFTGSRSDVNDFYAVSDIFLLPTRYEPFSNVILEAMSFGSAVFTTQQNGASEILENAFVMSNSRDFEVASQIDGLLSNPERLEEIKRGYKEKVKEFSMDRNVEETLRVIDEVIH